ncbi:NOL1/NOP2/sun family, putative [Leishmania donovani]|uniref:NOL1/NOP2/Sun domain family member 4 n=1 Tax=Leishmania donovani TaxID=5661 RepID=A0A3Q8ID92_LEIDO|nr:NOL1/NOP2/sun family, putative [Leishmania donovani]
MPPLRGTGRGRNKAGTVPTAHTKGGFKAKGSAKPRTFDEYYSEIYGKRWPTLRAAMIEAPRKVALWNRFSQVPFEEATRGLSRVEPNSLIQAFQPARKVNSTEAASTTDRGISADDEARLQEKALAAAAGDLLHPNGVIDKPPIDAFGIKAYYLLDYASAHVVEQLQVGAFDTVLDMCAAPGGKSVAVAQFLSPDGALTCNEARADRCARLRRNLQEHVPVNYVPWRTTQRDAQTWYDPGAFSRVLVDAPCSSERHLLQQSGGSPLSLREWSEETTAQLAALQRMLLQRAIETCRVGGRIVYSTCSISPLENDGVVSEVLQRTRCEVKVIKTSSAAAAALVAPPKTATDASESDASGAEACAPHTPTVLGEATAYGRLLLPDTCHGWGPMFFCVLEKTAEHKDVPSSSSEDDGD